MLIKILIIMMTLKIQFNHAIKRFSLAQLFEKLNKANAANGKKRRFNKIMTNKIGSNIIINNNNKLKNNLFKENINSKEEDENHKESSKERKRLLSKILLNFLDKQNINNNTDTNNNINKDEFSNNNDNENEFNSVTLNNFIETLTKGNENLDINLKPEELKQVLTEVIQQDKNRKSINKYSNNKNGNENEEMKQISEPNQNEFNIDDIDNINNVNDINDINNTNKKNNSNKNKKNEKNGKNKSLSKTKEKPKQKKGKNKNKKKEVKRISTKNKEEITKEKIISPNEDIIDDIDIINNEYNELNDIEDDINNNSQNNDNIKDTAENKKNINKLNEQKENEKAFNKNKKINRNAKKSILIMKNQNENYLIKSKTNKNVRFSVPSRLNINKKVPNNLDLETNNEILSRKIGNDILTNNELQNKLRSNSNYTKNNQFPFDNINNDNSFFDEQDIKIIKAQRKHSTKTTSISRNNSKIKLIDSYSKPRKKKFQKTKRDKNKHLIILKNDDSSENENVEYIVELREEILNRKLKIFFGKIKMLKNASENEYDEQLKTFIDNEIDKLNDWETKEQEIRINNFFSDLRHMKKRITIGGDIKYANPIKFSSTLTDFAKFKDL